MLCAQANKLDRMINPTPPPEPEVLYIEADEDEPSRSLW
jgi:hypothetical protein